MFPLTIILLTWLYLIYGLLDKLLGHSFIYAVSTYLNILNRFYNNFF